MPVPVVKSVELTVAVQPRPRVERESDTVTVPSEPETDEAPAVVVPKLTESGAVRERVPVTTVNVTLVGPVLAPAAPAAEAVRAASVSTNASRTDSGRRNGSPEGRAVDTEKGKDRWARRHPPMAPRPVRVRRPSG